MKQPSVSLLSWSTGDCRLARASAQLVHQREALSRATAALDRAIDVLMPDAAPAGRVYTATGLSVPLRGSSYNA